MAELKTAEGLKALGALAAVLPALVALLVLAVYLPVTHRVDALTFAITGQSIACILVAGNLAWNLRRNRIRAPWELVGQIGLLLCLTVVLLGSIGQQ